MVKQHAKLTDLNTREVSQIQELILERYPNTELIFLHGDLAEGTPRNVVGGYELLVLVEKKNIVDLNVLLAGLDKTFPREGRVMKKITVHILSIDFFRHNLFKSEFLYSIFHKGILVYEKQPDFLKDLDIHRKVGENRIMKIQEMIKSCLFYADKLMDVAGQMETSKHWYINHLFLFHASEQLFMALEYRYFGFIRYFDNISKRFKVARYTSEKLFNYSEAKKRELFKMFKYLDTYKTNHVMNNSSYTVQSMQLYTDLIMEIEEIVIEECKI